MAARTRTCATRLVGTRRRRTTRCHPSPLPLRALSTASLIAGTFARAQYNNPATSTCVRRDRSEDFKSVMTTAVGGRNLVGSATLEKCQWYQVVEKSNSSEKCAGPAALTTNRCQVNNISQDVSLDASGCTSAADKGKCMSDRTQCALPLNPVLLSY